MNLMAKWNRWFRRGGVPGTSLAEDTGCEHLALPGLDTLQARLNHWSHLWVDDELTGESEVRRLVAERLTLWMERCLGQHVHRHSARGEEPISLASSTPILTAFLGRRATRELSRRVLRDI